MEVFIRPSQQQMDRLVRELAHIEGGAPKAMAAALNRTATGVKTDIKKEVSKIYTIKQADVGNAIKSGKKATPGNLEASVIGEFKPIQLARFSYKRKRIVDRRKRRNWSITAAVKRGESKLVQDAFLGKGKFIAKRVGKDRYPIKVLYGPSVSQMMDNDGIAGRVMSKANVRLDKEISRALAAVEGGKLWVRR
jgi:hypothetical protein